MSALRALGASALSLLVPASLLLVTATGSATEASGEPAASQSARRNAEQTVHLVALPQIVQPGGRVASPDDAKAAFTATIEPIAAGRKVRLQVRRGFLLADGGGSQPGQERPCRVRRPLRAGTAGR